MIKGVDDKVYCDEKESIACLEYQGWQFQVILSRFETLKSPIETQLREFVKIVKYNDLNLWSVKLSAQKAHQQLFRIVKQFKVSCNVEFFFFILEDETNSRGLLYHRRGVFVLEFRGFFVLESTL